MKAENNIIDSGGVDGFYYFSYPNFCDSLAIFLTPVLISVILVNFVKWFCVI